MRDKQDLKLVVIGLGYVGLPLAAAFAKRRKVIGFDINERRIAELANGIDSTRELSAEELSQAHGLAFTSRAEDLSDADVYIITVPTPIDANNKPDLAPLISATEQVATMLGSGNIVIYESTVFPGATEEVCVPILEKISSLTYNREFFCGYSPERINPGDKTRRLNSIVKITSGSNLETAEFISALYAEIIDAGVYQAESIKVAEAAKVIENTQRDVNIALINELSIIFSKLNVNTESVLKAAETKWNFIPFRPGFVGGHCIGVDPFYLTHKAQEVGYEPEIILAGRKLNDNMARYVSTEFVSYVNNRNNLRSFNRVLILGYTFKEDCPDVRNTKIIDLVTSLLEHGFLVDVYDPWVEGDLNLPRRNCRQIHKLETNNYCGVLVCVAHTQFKSLDVADIRRLCCEGGVVFDIKSIYPRHQVDFQL